MMGVIILVDAEDPAYMEIAEDENGERLVFNSHDEAESWCESNAAPGRSYMHWDGER